MWMASRNFKYSMGFEVWTEDHLKKWILVNDKGLSKAFSCFPRLRLLRLHSIELKESA